MKRLHVLPEMLLTTGGRSLMVRPIIARLSRCLSLRVQIPTGRAFRHVGEISDGVTELPKGSTTVIHPDDWGFHRYDRDTRPSLTELFETTRVYLKVYP